MKCPHCLVEFHDEKEISPLGKDSQGEWAIEKFDCPNPDCKKSIFFLIEAKLQQDRNTYQWHILQNSQGQELLTKRELIRPKGSSRPPVPKETP